MIENEIIIEGVLLTNLKIISSDQGKVLYGLNKDEDSYNGFGEVYFSTVKHNAIKSWRRHKRMTLNLIVPIGTIRFILYDDRNLSKTNGSFNEIIISKDNYQRITIPPMIWFAFQGIGEKSNFLLNISNLKHDDSEQDRKNLNEISFKW